MAALTVVTALTTAFVQVISDGSDYVLQNIGGNPVYLYWKATAPLATDIGMQIMPGDGIDSNTFLRGDIWARASKDVSKVSVNQ